MSSRALEKERSAYRLHKSEVRSWRISGYPIPSLYTQKSQEPTIDTEKRSGRMTLAVRLTAACVRQEGPNRSVIWTPQPPNMSWDSFGWGRSRLTRIPNVHGRGSRCRHMAMTRFQIMTIRRLSHISSDLDSFHIQNGNSLLISLL